MPYFNQIIISGHLTRDAELRYTPNGNGVTNFTVAVNRAYDKEKTDFFRVTCWNRGNFKLAEWNGNLKKGKLVTVIGECQIEEYKENKYPNINANRVIVDNPKKEPTEGSQTTTPPPAPAENDGTGAGGGGEWDDDDFDVPF